MHEEMVALLIPITVSLGAFMMVWGLRYLQNKENMAMIERGIDPSANKRQRHANPSQTLRNGLMFVGSGLGLLLAIITTTTLGMTGDEGTGIYFSLIAIFGGLGMLGAYLYERKNPPTFPE